MKKITTKIAASAAIIGAVFAAATSASAALSPSTPASNSCSYVFSQNLKYGMRGAEVMNLQKVLNMFPGTTVSAFGAGSVGMETNYFGAATRAAVSRFQVLNASEVLAPIGATVGTGNVFSLTRAALNQICAGTVVVVPPTPTATTSGSVSVSLSPNQPYSVLVSGQAAARLADFTFNGNGTVTSINLIRTGVSSNSTLNNVYLYDGVNRLTDAASVSTTGAITFNSTTGIFSVLGTKVLTVRADIAGATSGQSVGVTLVGYTVMGSTMAATSVAGAQLPIANVGLATVAITNNQANTVLPVDAGTMNRNVWDITANIGTRAVNMRGLTLKYVGSAPIDALANVRLFVDGAQVGSASAVRVNGLLTFDLSGTPAVLNTGNRTIQVRADIMKGSSRTFQFQAQNVADYMFEDSQLAGVNVSPTGGSNVYGYNFSIGNGNLVTSMNPAFVANKVVGGANNTTIGSFKLEGRGEDVKVETLIVTPVEVTAFTAAAAVTSPKLQNVTVYVNGGAVGSTQSWTTGNLTFNLGSSLIVPAGSSTIVEVKADMRDNGGQSYTGGSVRVDLSNTSVARGQSSQNSVAVTTVTGRTLTISTASATFSRTSGFNASTVSPNTNDVKVGSFTLQNNDVEDVRATNLMVNLNLASGMLITDLNTLRISETGSTSYTNPTATGNNFSIDTVVTKNSSKTFDIFANVNNPVAGASVTADATMTYRGVSTAISTVSGLIAGSTITVNTGTILAADVTRNSASPVSQLVVGESTGSIVTYNVKSSNGGSNINEMTFSFPADTIKAITKINGVATPAGYSISSTGATIANLSIAVPQGGSGVLIPIEVTYGKVSTPGNGGIASQTTAATILSLDSVKYTSGTNPQVTLALTGKVSNGMQLVKSKPALTVSNADTLTLAAIGKIANVAITADLGGRVSVNKLTFNTSHSGFAAAPTLASATLRDGSVVIPNVTCVIATLVTTCTFTAGNAYEIAGGSSKTFSLFAQVNGTAAASTKASIATQVTNATNDFQWYDVDGSATVLDGTNVYNFPTNSSVSSQN